MIEEKPKGPAKGGIARAEKLSAEERSEIASKGAAKRWEERPTQWKPGDLPRVLPGRKGVLDISGTKLPVAVIEGPGGIQRVISEFGVTTAILGSRSGASKRKKKASSEDGALVPIFVAPRQLNAFISDELRAGPLAPIDYLDGDRVVRGYDSSILAVVCEIWLSARDAGALQDQQLEKAKRAEVLTRALAKTGVIALIDEVTGYEKERPQNALQAYLALIISKELAAWVKRFPDEFYENIYKLKGWKWPGMGKNRFSVVAHYTRDLIYERMGPGVLKELGSKTPKNDKGHRPNKFHQWLTSEIGDPILAQHMQSILTLQRLSIKNGWGWKRFLSAVGQVLPRKGTTLELPFDEP